MRLDGGVRRESDDHDHGNHEECEGEEDEPRPILKRERTDSIWGEGCDEFFITAAALAALAVPSAAMADVTNNPSTNDSYGYATANANRLRQGRRRSRHRHLPLRLDRRRSFQPRSQRLHDVSRLGQRPGRFLPDQQQRQIALLIRPDGGGLASAGPPPLTFPRASFPRGEFAGVLGTGTPKNGSTMPILALSRMEDRSSRPPMTGAGGGSFAAKEVHPVPHPQ